jgi:putative endonuclease
VQSQTSGMAGGAEPHTLPCLSSGFTMGALNRSDTGCHNYCIYLLECRDGSYYCGITTDMEQRLRQHNQGKASRYTRGRTPVTVLVRTGYWFSKSRALKHEKSIKKFPRHKKPSLVAMITKTVVLPIEHAT